MKAKQPSWGLFPSQYGRDPYNTLDQHTMAQTVVRSYHGPLTAVAYRHQRHWDFAPGVSSAVKIQTYRYNLPSLLRRQAS